MRNTLVTYDREHEKVGFWKTNCSELWERLHVSPASPPLPSGSNEGNSNADMAPELAPTVAPEPKTPGLICHYFLPLVISCPNNMLFMRPKLEWFITYNLEKILLYHSTMFLESSMIFADTRKEWLKT